MFAYLQNYRWTESDRTAMQSNGSAPGRQVATILGVCGGYLTSVNNYDARASNLTVQLADGANCANSTLNTWVDTRLMIDASNNIQISCNQSMLKAGHRIGGTFTVVNSAAYNPTSMKWLRLRENAGTTFYEYSPDRTTWTTLASEANPIAMTAVKVQLAGDAWPGPAGTVKVDNVNTAPAPTPTPTPTSTPTPPPTPAPTPCSQYTPSTVISTGFASPYDVVSSPNTNLMTATCLNLTDARLDLGKGDPLQYIYNTGYLFKTGQTNWTPINYTSTEQLIANAWYPKTATANITMTSTELQNPNYNLAYICSWTGTNWKCGCRDAACMQSYWQIQSFKR